MGFGLGFVGQVLIARGAGLAGLGEYSAVTAVLNLAAVISAAGVPAAAGRLVGIHLQRGEDGEARRVADAGWLLTLGSSIVMALLALVSWDALAGVMHLRDPLPRAVIAAAIPFGAVAAYGNQLFQATLGMKRATAIYLAQPLTIAAAAAASLALPWIRPGPIAVAADVAAGVGAAILLLLAGQRPAGRPAKLGTVLRESGAFAAGAYGQVAFQQTDRVVVSIVLGQTALGVYSAADTLASAAMRIINTLRWFLVPVYGRLSLDTSGRLERFRSLHVRLWSAYAIVLMAAIVASANGIVGVIYGSGTGDVRTPLRVLSLGVEAQALTVALFTAITGVGQFRTVLVVTWAAAVVQVGLLASLAAAFDVPGAAVARLVALVLSAAAYAAVAVRLGASVRPMVVAVAAWIAAALLAYAISFLPIVWPLRAVLGGIAAVAVAAVLLLGKEERSVVRRLLLFR